MTSSGPASRRLCCGYCGHRYPIDAPWPRTCEGCGRTSWLNPLPVVVLIVPIEGGGVLAVRRGIEPGKGKLALPGGFLDVGETWQDGVARELREETHLEVAVANVELFDVTTDPKNGFLLIFGRVAAMPASVAEGFVETDETTELVVLREPVELAFPLHTEALAKQLGRD